MSKEIALAEQFKKKIDEEAEKDPIRFKITEHLNKLTVDNYKITAQDIYQIIEKDIESQEKFLDVLFNKSVNEKDYVKLYAKLCKEKEIKFIGIKRSKVKRPRKENQDNIRRKIKKKRKKKT